MRFINNRFEVVRKARSLVRLSSVTSDQVNRILSGQVSPILCGQAERRACRTGRESKPKGDSISTSLDLTRIF